MAKMRRSAREWHELVSEWETSGLSAREYAARQSLNPRTLSWWRWKLGQLQPQPQRFVEMVLEAPPAPDLVVELGPVHIRVPAGFDAGELRRLVTALC